MMRIRMMDGNVIVVRKEKQENQRKILAAEKILVFVSFKVRQEGEVGEAQ